MSKDCIKYRTLTEAMLAAPAEKPFVTMWRDEDDVASVTFGEFIHLAQLQAVEFLNRGVEPNQRIVLIMSQGIPLMISFAAAMLVGAAPAIIAYPNFKVEPTKYRSGLVGVSNNLKARLIVIDQDFPEDMLCYLPDEEPVELVRVGSDSLSNETTIPELPALSEGIAFIQHSAGTTGLQKGVALSHGAVLKQLGHLATMIEITDRDRIYSWLPLYHDMGLIACFMLPLVYHVPVVMQSPTDWVMRPGSMLALISQFRCTLTWVPNFALQFLARRVPTDDRRDLDLSSLRMLINCSEPIRERSIREFYSAYAQHGLRRDAIQTSYAMAENVFAVTQSGAERDGTPTRIWVDTRSLLENDVVKQVQEADESSMCLVSSGRCLPGSEVLIVRANKEVPDGHVGEILIRSDCLFAGYYNRSDLTAKAMKDGWYWSGDLGFRLSGELYVIGRKNDLIIVGGKNLYPQDIEEIAYSHPSIYDGRAVAFGLFDPNLGTEEIFVVAEVKDEAEFQNAASIEQTIRNGVVAELGVTVREIYLKPPKWVVKSTAGKPARSANREKLVKEHPELKWSPDSGRN